MMHLPLIALRARKGNAMSLQETLDAFRTNFEAGGPPYSAPAWIHEPMHRATDELIASADLLRHGPLVVSFYRGVWCPYCNMELQALQAALPELEKRGAKLVAISPQAPVNSRRSVRENKLSFPILSDTHNEVAAAFGLRFKLPDYLIDLYRDVFKNDLTLVNGDESWTLPMPARFVIAQDGTIAYAEVNPDYTQRPDPSELLPALDKVTAVAA
jgi:peroxiredoxin